MGIYKYGRYSEQGYWDIYPVTFHAIYKKTLFGWKEFNWWKDSKNGQRKMEETVEVLRKSGHVVYPE